MARALELAAHGLGTTYPNPLVGCVIVHKDTIIGQGFHHHAGGPHAEVVAISQIQDDALLRESTLYVTLEPCSHFGKTPPCANLILAKKIPHVVICNTDPNPKVAGSGIKLLRDAGVVVQTGVLESAGREVNRRFFTFFEKHRPYIILKWAQSADGFLAPETREEKRPVWITGNRSRQVVHKWRTEEQAILIGTKTALDDNPELTARYWHGNQPLRILIDKTRKVKPESHIFDSQSKTVVFHDSETTAPVNAQLIRVAFDDVPARVVKNLYQMGLQSVIVEGGAKTLESFIKAGLWDEARVFTGLVKFGQGTAAPQIEARIIERTTVGDDQLILYRP